MRKKLVLSVAAFSLTLAGCSTGEPQSEGASDQELSPLEAKLSFLTEAFDLTEEQALENAMRQQELISQCMKDQGFEYIPTPPILSVVGPKDRLEMRSREYAEEYGYGIVNSPHRETADQAFEEAKDRGDPNEEYLASINPSEQAAYYDTLVGREPTDEELKSIKDGKADYDPAEFGCVGWANYEDEKNSPYAFYEDPEFEELNRAMDDLWMNLYNYDPDVEQLDSEWSTCMMDAGYPVSGRKVDADSDLSQRWNEWQESHNPFLPSEFEAFKEEFQKDEIPQAIADYECSEEVDYWGRFDAIRDWKQQELIDRYEKQIDVAILRYGSE